MKARGLFLAFDYGEKRIGCAVGQRLTQTARPLPTIVNVKRHEPQWDKINKVIQEWKPEALIVGIPRDMYDQSQQTTIAALTFAADLKTKYSLTVHQIDERLTTREARAEVFAQGGYKALQKSEIDSIAACLILEQWLKQQAFDSNF